MAERRIIVIGAGVGGLVAAVLLAARGESVLVLEKEETAGGKLRRLLGIDAGPTVFTMRWVFEEVFAAAGEALDRHLTLKPLAILARHAWGSDAVLDLHADMRHSAEAIGAFAGAGEARRFLGFAEEARSIYDQLREPFLLSQKPGPVGLAMHNGLHGLSGMLRINPFETMWKALGRHFADARLRQLFGRYATYCGSSPFQSPATLMLVAHVEQQGVWAVEGGMRRLIEALVDLAQKLGVEFRFGAGASEIMVERGAVAAVETADGERHPCADIVFNGDVNALATGLLGADAAQAAKPLAVEARSLSAVTWCVRGRTRGFPLHRHNVFFSRDCEAEFRDLGTGYPREPTVYVCAEDRDGAVAGAERLMILVNAAARGDEPGPEVEQAMRNQLARAGLEIDWVNAEWTVTTPRQFAQLFPATGGALYGRASHGWMASFQRPGAATKIPGLYLAGGSAHPGPGVPMAALSARLAVEALLAARASARRFRPMAIAGGMSTR